VIRSSRLIRTVPEGQAGFVDQCDLSYVGRLYTNLSTVEFIAHGLDKTFIIQQIISTNAITYLDAYT
jgi:hypothetical protein